MSKKKGCGTKVIASVPYPSILLFSSGSRGPALFLSLIHISEPTRP